MLFLLLRYGQISCGCQEITIDYVKNKIVLTKIVIFFTCFGTLFKTNNYFLDYPVLTHECAEYLVSQNIEIVGLDSPSVDKSPYHIYKILLINDVLIIENLVNLEKLVDIVFEIILPCL
jgi:kynurenine formamidase